MANTAKQEVVEQTTLALAQPSETDTLISQVNDARSKMQSALEFHQGQVAKLQAALGVEAEAIPVTLPTSRRGRPSKPRVARTAEPKTGVGRGRGARGNNKFTIPEAVTVVLKQAGRAGLSRADITAKILMPESKGGIGYESTSETAEDFSNSVYATGINKLVKEGVVETIGERPNTKYRLKK